MSQRRTRPIGARRRQRLAVRSKRDATDPPLMPLQDERFVGGPREGMAERGARAARDRIGRIGATPSEEGLRPIIADGRCPEQVLAAPQAARLAWGHEHEHCRLALPLAVLVVMLPSSRADARGRRRGHARRCRSPACASSTRRPRRTTAPSAPASIRITRGCPTAPPATSPRSPMPSSSTRPSAGSCPTRKRRLPSCKGGSRRTAPSVNVAGTNDPKSPSARIYNTTQGLVALHALGVKPKYDPLPVFEQVMKADYKDLPPYSTSFFPLAYRAAGKTWPREFDRRVRALMVQADDGYLNDHIAATFHAAHYYALLGEPTPKAEAIVKRALRDQKRGRQLAAQSAGPRPPRHIRRRLYAEAPRRRLGRVPQGHRPGGPVGSELPQQGRRLRPLPRQPVRRRRDLFPGGHAGDGGIPEAGRPAARLIRSCSAGGT